MPHIRIATIGVPKSTVVEIDGKIIPTDNVATVSASNKHFMKQNSADGSVPPTPMGLIQIVVYYER